MDSLWSRRTNSNKLSLATSQNGGEGGPSSRNASFSKRFGGDSSSHGRSNPFNGLPTPGGSVASPGGGAEKINFGLGSGAFAAFTTGKTPRTPGNPFEAALGGAKTPGDKAVGKEGESDGKVIGKPASSASLAESKGTIASSTSTGRSTTLASHPLRTTWVFWFRPPSHKGTGYVEYEKTLHAMASCATAEEFFAVYRHLKRPSVLPLVSDYHLFRKDVRPIWEDEENKSGGKWIVRLKKGVADRFWEDLLFAIIGDQFGEAGEEICGAVLSVRNGEDILSVWMRADGGRVLRIRETMKRLLGFPPDTKVEWKSHDTSIQQRTAIDEARRDKANSHHAEKRSSKTQQAAEDSKVAP